MKNSHKVLLLIISMLTLLLIFYSQKESGANVKTPTPVVTLPSLDLTATSDNFTKALQLSHSFSEAPKDDSTIFGLDSNNNGIRDSIEYYITTNYGQRFGDNSMLMRSFLFYAWSVEEIVRNETDFLKFDKKDQIRMAALPVLCIGKAFYWHYRNSGKEYNYDESFSVLEELSDVIYQNKDFTKKIEEIISDEEMETPISDQQSIELCGFDELKEIK